MHEINRSLMVVRPQQPFLDWVRSVEETSETLELEDMQDDCSAYLVPECETLEDQMAVILWCWDVIFDEELYAWHTDEAVWPTDRTPEMFMEWFDVEFHSTVHDLIEDLPLERVEYDKEDESSSSNGNSGSNGI